MKLRTAGASTPHLLYAPEELRNEFANCRCCSWSVRTPFAGESWNSIDDWKLYWFWEAAKSNISCRTVCVRLYTYSMNTLDRAACLVHSMKQFGKRYWDKSFTLCDFKQPKNSFSEIEFSKLNCGSCHSTQVGFLAVLTCAELTSTIHGTKVHLISMWEICMKSKLLFIQISHIEIRAAWFHMLLASCSPQSNNTVNPLGVPYEPWWAPNGDPNSK